MLLCRALVCRALVCRALVPCSCAVLLCRALVCRLFALLLVPFVCFVFCIRLVRLVSWSKQIIMNSLQPTHDGALQPENGALQPENGALQPENGALQPENGALQPENGALQPENGALQPTHDGALQPAHGALPPCSEAPNLIDAAVGWGLLPQDLPQIQDHAQDHTQDQLPEALTPAMSQALQQDQTRQYNVHVRTVSGQTARIRVSLPCRMEDILNAPAVRAMRPTATKVIVRGCSVSWVTTDVMCDPCIFVA